MKLKLILFDFSGTLAYLRKSNPKNFFSDLKNFGININDTNIQNFVDLFSKVLGNSKNWFDFSKKLLEVLSKDDKKLAKNLANFLEENVVFKLYDDVKCLKNLKIKKAILSANAKFLIKEFPLKGFKIFTPKETKFLKPDKRAFLKVINYFKIKPEETLMVGDELERDLIPAKKLGMKTILIDRENSIKNSPVQKIKSLAELKTILV